MLGISKIYVAKKCPALFSVHFGMIRMGQDEKAPINEKQQALGSRGLNRETTSVLPFLNRAFVLVKF